jgi:DNA-binding GntR family transcriptional regulator
MAQQGGRIPAKYRQIADDLRARIERGEWPVGTQMPALPELAAQYQAAQGTIDKALEVLRQMGLAETIHGTGTFVRKPPEEPPGEYEITSRRLDEVVEVVRQLSERLAAVERQVFRGEPSGAPEPLRDYLRQQLPEGPQ